MLKFVIKFLKLESVMVEIDQIPKSATKQSSVDILVWNQYHII